jgi:hypothetical protein
MPAGTAREGSPLARAAGVFVASACLAGKTRTIRINGNIGQPARLVQHNEPGIRP